MVEYVFCLHPDNAALSCPAAYSCAGAAQVGGLAQGPEAGMSERRTDAVLARRRVRSVRESAFPWLRPFSRLQTWNDGSGTSRLRASQKAGRRSAQQRQRRRTCQPPVLGPSAGSSPAVGILLAGSGYWGQVEARGETTSSRKRDLSGARGGAQVIINAGPCDAVSLVTCKADSRISPPLSV